MTLFLDASALVKLYVTELSSADVRRWVAAASSVAASRLAYPEARAALARRHREKAFSAAALRRAVADLDADLGSIVVVDVDAQVAHQAGDLAERLALRGFDALHLACALELSRLVGRPCTFAAFDGKLVAAARVCGLAVLP